MQTESSNPAFDHEFPLVCNKRAEVYWWLSTLLALELSDDTLAQYRCDTVQPFLEGLATTPTLAGPVAELQAAIAALNLRPDAQLELAADFADIFLGDHKRSAPPYESVYTSEKRLLMQEACSAMEQLLSRHGIDVNEQFREPADHLAIQLDFIGNLAIKAGQAEEETTRRQLLNEQREFLQQHLLNWLPKLSEDVTRIDRFGFYSTVIKLLLAFCQADLSFIEEALS